MKRDLKRERAGRKGEKKIDRKTRLNDKRVKIMAETKKKVGGKAGVESCDRGEKSAAHTEATTPGRGAVKYHRAESMA